MGTDGLKLNSNLNSPHRRSSGTWIHFYGHFLSIVVFVQLPSPVWLSVTPWAAACQASLSLTISQNLPCPLVSSCPLNRWCHLTIWSFVASFSSCPQSLSASGSFSMSQFFESVGQSIGASTLAPVLLMSIQGWFPSGLTGLISLLSKELSWVFSSNRIWKQDCSPGWQLDCNLSLIANLLLDTWPTETGR